LAHPKDRGERRRKLALLKERAASVISRKYQLDVDNEKVLQAAARQVNHLCNCSCALCGNPRRYIGEVTFQERRENADRFDR